ncbi:serine hydrolase [Natronorubrum texcoconense]|uniref:Beta-lactamase class A n=1 Tax=Natronorubrum texcoconense TaxID=1095776 RepID=A0A1G9D973_9EURY|nr:serine hydrolase [Natronorubrum texcoconense]SDK60393.1 beta-lactamase class A [Natronorubrum texcoconense]
MHALEGDTAGERSVTGPRPELESWTELRSAAKRIDERLDGRLGMVVCDAGPDQNVESDHDVESDSSSTPLVAIRPTERFGAASLVKLPILYALYRTYDGRLADLDRPHSIAPENRVGGDGLFHLLSDPTPTTEDLATAMISVSDNAATNELIDHLGFDAIDEGAADLGLEGTRLGRKMMQTPAVDPSAAALETDRASPIESNGHRYVNWVTPRDCATLLSDIHGGRTLSSAAYERLARPLAHQHDGSMVPRYLPPDVDILHKTGNLPSVAADAGLLTVGERTVAYAICCDGLEHRGEGVDAIAELSAGVYRILEQG